MALNATPPWLLAPAVANLWRGDGAQVFGLSRAAHALTLITALFSARGRVNFRAWFPAYYCENALLRLRQSGAVLKFYPMTEAMSPDWAACHAMLSDGAPDLLVLPHFFGVENEAAEARAFCDQVGALLLEDGAHLLQPVGSVGRHGDFACYSPRKYLDLPDAGILVVRSETLAQEIADASASLAHTPLSIAPWILARLRRVLVPRRRRSSLPLRGIDDDVAQVPMSSSIWINPTSRRRLEVIGAAGVDAVAIREGHVANRLDALAPDVGLEPLPRHRDATPYFIGYRAPSVDSAQRIMDRLRRAGGMVNTWPGMPPEVKAEPERYGAAMNLRRTLLRFTPRTSADRRPLDFLRRLDA